MRWQLLEERLDYSQEWASWAWSKFFASASKWPNVWARWEWNQKQGFDLHGWKKLTNIRLLKAAESFTPKYQQCNWLHILYVRHYNRRFVYSLPHFWFSLQFILQTIYVLKTEILHFSSLKSAVYTQERVIVVRVWYICIIFVNSNLHHLYQSPCLSFLSFSSELKSVFY